MYNIFSDLNEFIYNILNHNVLVLNESGDWKPLHTIIKYLILILLLKNKYKLKLLLNFNHCFGKLETIPIRFNTTEQTLNFARWLQAAEALKSYFPHADSKQVKQQLNELERRSLALKYRLEKINGGLNTTSVNPQLHRQLLEKAQLWKLSQGLFWNPILSQQDLKILTEACQFSAFVQIVLKNELLCTDFFNWTLRDGIPAAPFIEFPAMRQKIIEANLNGRIGHLGGTHLAVIKMLRSQGTLEKVLALRFDGVFISILDENHKITLNGGYTLTICEIFAAFKNKCFFVGNLEFFENGVTNWNSHHLGLWNPKNSKVEPIDLEKGPWWHQLPILEILDTPQAIERYGMPLDGYHWVVSANASREYLTLHFDKTHAYLEIAIPIQNGCYAIYVFGKFATKFPTGSVEALLMVTVSVLATIAYPDENVFYTHRQHAGYPFMITPGQGNQLMASIKADILEARQENSVFQMESENCGKWIQTKLEELLGPEVVPNLYRINLIYSEPHGFLGFCWRIIRRMPKFCRSKILAWCHFPLGAWKGLWITDRTGQKVWKSLYASSFWRDGIVYLPPHLHQQMKQGKLKKK